MKVLIPLMGIDCTKDDFTKEAGFIDAYMQNKNNDSLSFLQNRIYLLYEAENITKRTEEVFFKFIKSPYCYALQHIRLNGKVYRLFVFSVVKKEMVDLYRTGFINLTVDVCKKLLNFWKFEQDDINKYVFGIESFLNVDTSNVPDEDYIEEDPLKG